MGGDRKWYRTGLHLVVRVTQTLHSVSLSIETALRRPGYHCIDSFCDSPKHSHNCRSFAWARQVYCDHPARREGSDGEGEISQCSLRMAHTWLISTAKRLYASDMFYLIATFSSRTAVLCLLYALSPEHLHKLVTKSGIRFSILVTVAAVLMIALGCDSGSPWTQISRECNSVVLYLFSRLLSEVR